MLRSSEAFADNAERTARRFAEGPLSRGIAVFGSYARGDYTPASDLDLLVIHAGRAPEEILDGLDPRVSVVFYTAERFARLPLVSPLFNLHLVTEAAILDDSHGLIGSNLGSVAGFAREDVARVAASSQRRMRDIVNLPPRRRLSGELYAVAKQSAMLLSAAHGSPTFNRAQAFEQLEQLAPQLSDDVRTAIRLETHWLSLRARYTQAAVSASASELEAVRRIVEAVTHVVGRSSR